MGDTMNRIFEVAEQVVDTAATTTLAVVAKGKSKIDKYSLQNRLAKAQRQLGKLVYTQQKTGDENPSLIALYVQEIDEIQEQLEYFAKPKETVAVHTCPDCGAGVKKDAMFCGGCGQKLS
ncbi:zinc ribbon domain-containing protein [Ruminococcaceae bacterium OttesenSCG-928-A16]|nr:zinc ribbon domain-containing protein [Ruminococcaceae bacterium OttesenSCG-928-A16]